MSEREISQANEEQAKDSLESRETKQEARSLEDVTSAPESYVEATVEFKDSEAVENVFTDLIGTDKQISQTEMPKTSKEEIQTIKKKEDGGEAATPINLPGPESKAIEGSKTGQVEPQRMEKELPEESQLEKELDAGMDVGSELEDIVGEMTGSGPGDIPDGMGSKREDDDPTAGLIGENGLTGMGDGGPEDLRGSMKGGPKTPETPPGVEGPFMPGKGPHGGETRMGMADQPWVEAAVMALIEYGTEDDIAAFESMLQESAMDEYQLVHTSPDDGDDDGDKGSGGSGETKSEDPEGGGGKDPSSISKADIQRVLDKLGEISMQDPDSPSSGSEGEGTPMITNERVLEILKRAMELKQELAHKQMKSGAEVVTDPDSEDPVPPGEDLGAKKGAT